MGRRARIVTSIVLVDLLLLSAAWWMVRVRTPDYPFAAASDTAAAASATGSDPASTGSNSAGGLPDAMPADTEVVGPLVLAIDPEGTVLRATLGDCQRGGGVRVWSGNLDDDASLGEPRPVDGLAQVRQASVRADELELVGLDPECMPVRATSRDGQDWQVRPLSGQVPWYYQDLREQSPPGVDEVVTTTAGPGDAALQDRRGCMPVQVVLDDEAGWVLCDDESVRVIDGQLPVVDLPAGASGVVLEPDRSVASVIDASCRGLITVVDYEDGRSAMATYCLDPDRAATALTRRGDDWVVQLGNSLLTSSDPATEDWQPVGR